MNKIMTLNVGSSSCKFQIFESNLDLIGKGQIDRVSIKGTNISYKDKDNNKITEEKDVTFDDLFDYLIKFLEEHNIVDLHDVSLVVHRVVNGGDEFKEDVVVSSTEILDKLKSINSLAPLHNPYNTETIEKFFNKYPQAKHVAVFDTTFHATMPKSNYLYALPKELYEKHKIRRYGAHGSSHHFITNQLNTYLNKDKISIINVHLGNGASVCAIKDNKSINTSMGFTPLAGLIMGTRTGDIDSAIVFHLINQLKMDPVEVENIFNKKSGLLGITGVSSDMRDIIELEKEGNEDAILARKMTAKRISDYIILYLNEIGPIDGISFTGGIGENDFELIQTVIKNINLTDIKLLDSFSNKEDINVISSDESPIKVFIVPTNEELYMAQVGIRLTEGTNE